MVAARGRNRGAVDGGGRVDHAPPYRILEPGRKTGLYLDMFEEMTNRLGWDVEYREAPFRRLQLMLHRGEIDMMLDLVRNGAREQWMEFVAPAFPPERRLFLYLDETNRVDRYQDLYGKTIGVEEPVISAGSIRIRIC